MKSILLIGLGRFGRNISYRLSELKHQVMAVDKREDRVNMILPYVTNAVIGDGTDEDFLRSLGVANFDLCIVAIGSDFQSSLEATSLLKDLGAPKVVSRAFDEVHQKFLLRNGADEIVYPERQSAYWTAVRYSTDNILDYTSLNGEYAIFEISVPKAWLNKTVGQLDLRKIHSINILGTKKDGKLDPKITPETYLSDDETLLVLSSHKEIQRINKL